MKLTPFGQYVRKKRIEKRITLKEHADALGISSPYLSGMETGRRDVLEKFIQPTADFLGLSEDEFQKLNESFFNSKNKIVLYKNEMTPNQFDVIKQLLEELE